METKEFENTYKIDKDRLVPYLERIQNQYGGLSQTQILSKFLHNQSIVNSEQFATIVLDFFKDKLAGKYNLTDFAFEWIRAKTIRLDYKKNLTRSQYPKLEVAIDDSIFLFFIEYDKYIRILLNPEIKEYEISCLYEIFFSPPESEFLDMEENLVKHKMKVPTMFKESTRVDTSIMTLRASVSQIVENDYKMRSVGISEENHLQNNETPQVSKPINGTKKGEFSGAALERLMKNYCFSKKQAKTQEILNASTQFLSTSLKFGVFYRFEDFKVSLIEKLAEYLHSGLTDKYKESFSLDRVKTLVSNVVVEFRRINQITVLDGLAWINDLKSVLKKIFETLLELLETPNEELLTKRSPASNNQDSSIPSNSDFGALFDLTMEVEDFRKKIEYSLSDSKLSTIEKNVLIRTKVQEFQTQKRRAISKR